MTQDSQQNNRQDCTQDSALSGLGIPSHNIPVVLSRIPFQPTADHFAVQLTPYTCRPSARQRLILGSSALIGYMDCSTKSSGSPYTLVCTKNQNSYERRVVQRRKDIEDAARLVGG